MADFSKGDRVVKMSGNWAGRYGTVNSVGESGTLNVTFDGERLPKYCDPALCGKVAANAKTGDWVTLKGDPSKTTMVVDEVRRDGHFRVTAIPGAWFTDSEVDIVKRASNSRAANAAEGELRALTEKAREWAESARAQGDAKTISDIARGLSLLKNAAVRNALAAAKRSGAVCNYSKGTKVYQAIAEGGDDERALARGMDKNITFQQLFEGMLKGKDFYRLTKLSDSDQKNFVLEELAGIYGIPSGALFDLYQWGPLDARVVDKWGKQLGLTKKEPPEVAQWKQMWGERCLAVGEKGSQLHQKCRRFWEKNKDKIKPFWKDWRDLKGIPWMQK